MLGALCAVDHQPNSINRTQADHLIRLADQVVSLLESRRSNIILRAWKSELTSKVEGLEEFSYAVVHDIQTPLNNLHSAAKLIGSNPNRTDDLVVMTEMIKRSSGRLNEYVSGLMQYYRSDTLDLDDPVEVDLNTYFKDLPLLVNLPEGSDLITPETSKVIQIRRVVLDHILVNLINNGIRHNSNSVKRIEVGFEETKEAFQFSVSDNGNGIDSADFDAIFNMLNTLDNPSAGSGIGLAVVKKLVEKEGGEVQVDSSIGSGSVFRFTISK